MPLVASRWLRRLHRLLVVEGLLVPGSGLLFASRALSMDNIGDKLLNVLGRTRLAQLLRVKWIQLLLVAMCGSLDQLVIQRCLPDNLASLQALGTIDNKLLFISI